VRYPSLSKYHKSPVLYHFLPSNSSKGDSSFLSTYHQKTFNPLTYIIHSFLAGCSLCVSKSKILTICPRIGNQTVHLLISTHFLNGFTAITGLHSVIPYHSIIVASGDFLENLTNKSFGHFSAQTIAIRRDLS
jgi:hypothetical protein